MTRITLLSAVAALAITPAAIAQSHNIPDEPDGAFMADSPTRLSGLVRAQGLPDDAEVIKTESVMQEADGYSEPKPEDPYIHDGDRDIIATGIKPDETPGMYLTQYEHPATDPDKLAQAFHAMDVNADGFVARSEWIDWQGGTPADTQFDRYSYNGDDILTLDEYRYGMESGRSPEAMTN